MIYFSLQVQRMSRVAQLDSTALDQELHNLFRSELSQVLNIRQNKEEWNLVLDTLVFFFGSKYTGKIGGTTTYGSKLSGVTYNCRKRTLFLISILSNYLNSLLSRILYASDDNPRINQIATIYKYLNKFYSAFDLLNFATFLLSTGQNKVRYLSPLHRLLGAASTTETHNPVSFYHNTVYAGIEFQNRQLLWNAILEFFNATLLNNARWLNVKKRRPVKSLNAANSSTTCARCQEFPTNPYTISCCRANYCYVCVVKALDFNSCDRCDETKNLTATPIY